MYKIYINNVPVYLTTKQGDALPDATSHSADILITDYANKKHLFEIIDKINSTVDLRACYILSRNPKSALTHLKKFFKIVEAAGGIVLNENQELLLIFRRGKWDLPKGKIDTGETKRKAAIREVKEETGVKKLRVMQALKLSKGKQSCTYHSYIENDVACLKVTYWFLMRSVSQGVLIPQLEEGIVQAEWVRLDRLGEFMENTYGSVRDVIEAVRSLI